MGVWHILTGENNKSDVFYNVTRSYHNQGEKYNVEALSYEGGKCVQVEAESWGERQDEAVNEVTESWWLKLRIW